MRDVFLLFSEVFTDRMGNPSHGGIQRCSRSFLRAARELPPTDYTFHALVLVDAPETPVPADHAPMSPGSYESFAWNRRKMFSTFVRRLQACRSPDPIILVGGVNLAGLAAVARFLRPKARIAMMLYGFEVFAPLSWWKRTQLRCVSEFWAISHFTRSRFCEVQRISPSCVEVVHLCLPPEWVFPENARVPSANRTGGAVTFLCVTRMRSHDAGKKVDILLQAFAELSRRCPDSRLVVVGDGVLRGIYERMAVELGIANSVQFAGNKSDEELKKLYDESDVFVFPSVKEGFGLVFLEAMAFGLPSIGARSTSVPEIVEHETTGLLAEPDDVGSLAGQMIRLAENSEFRRQLGEAGRKRAADVFSFSRFTRRIHELLAAA